MLMLRKFWYMTVFGYQEDMYLATVVAAVVAFFGGVYATRDGDWWLLPIWAVVLSPVAMYILRRWWEDDSLSLFNSKASKAFMYGDVAVLPVVFGFAVYGWRQVPSSNWMTGYAFAAGCLGIGAICACLFRLMDGRRYIESRYETMLDCPTKVWHDWAVFPVAIGMLLWLLLPQLFAAWSVATVAALAFLLQFLLLTLLDAVDPPDPKYQHVEWDAEQFCPVTADTTL